MVHILTLQSITAVVENSKELFQLCEDLVTAFSHCNARGSLEIRTTVIVEIEVVSHCVLFTHMHFGTPTFAFSGMKSIGSSCSLAMPRTFFAVTVIALQT